MLNNLQLSSHTKTLLRLNSVYTLVSVSLLGILMCFSCPIQALAATTIQYTYDNQNRLTRVVYANGVTQIYGYDAAGNRVSFSSATILPPVLTLNAVTTPASSASQIINGTTDSGATVNVSLNGGNAIPATVTGTSWSFAVTGLISGNNTISVVAGNAAGGTTERNASIRYAQKLTVTVNGTDGGGGTITSDPAGISCVSGSAFDFFDHGLSVNLLSTPNINSLLFNWSDNCTGSGACQVTMDSPKSVTATFTFVQPARIPGSPPKEFSSIGDAYATMTGNGTIQTRAYEFSGDLLLNKGITLTIDGGYDTSFQNRIGYAILNGILTIKTDFLTSGNLVIK